MQCWGGVFKDNRIMQVAWHYTTLETAHLIEADGRLRPAAEGLAPGEKSILWFSLSQEWEPTATKWLGTESPDGTMERKLATPAEMIEFAGGLVRYGVHPSAKLASCPGRRLSARQGCHGAWLTALSWSPRSKAQIRVIGWEDSSHLPSVAAAVSRFLTLKLSPLAGE